jgi:hypothetical protein
MQNGSFWLKRHGKLQSVRNNNASGIVRAVEMAQGGQIGLRIAEAIATEPEVLYTNTSSSIP